MKLFNFETGEPKEDIPSPKKEQLKEVQEHTQEILERVIDRLDEKIGEGNSAEVYIDSKYPEVCVKIIRHGGVAESKVNTPQIEANFLSEAHGLEAEVNIPFPYFTVSADYENDDGEMVRVSGIIMERIHGVNLEEIVMGKAGLPEAFNDPHNVRDFFKKLHGFLEKLNQAGVYHEDLRLRNIMVDEEGGAWVLDFGLSKKKQQLQSEEVEASDVEFLKSAQKSFVEYYKGRHIDKK